MTGWGGQISNTTSYVCRKSVEFTKTVGRRTIVFGATNEESISQLMYEVLFKYFC